MIIIRTMHHETIVEGYVDEAETQEHIEWVHTYNRVHPFDQASVTFFNHGFNLGSWESGNQYSESAREKVRIVYPQLMFFEELTNG